MSPGYNYVHGYSEREHERLLDQSDAVREIIHHDTFFEPGSSVLEVGCGIGAQTVYFAKKFPDTHFVSFDISEESLKKAKNAAHKNNIKNVEFHHADIFNLSFKKESFDCIYINYVLEHLTEPEKALLNLKKVLKKDGKILVVEGDHGSCYYNPYSDYSVRVWNLLIEVQALGGADSLIGRRLYPLLKNAEFRDLSVSPRMIYIDHSNPQMVDAFVVKTIIAMVEGVKDKAIELKLINAEDWKHGIDDLFRVVHSPDGTFCYTFFKAYGLK